MRKSVIVCERVCVSVWVFVGAALDLGAYSLPRGEEGTITTMSKPVRECEGECLCV